MDGLLMKYFVLKPSGRDEYASASRRAMCAYADAIEATNAGLAHDLREWAGRELAVVNAGRSLEGKHDRRG